MKRIFCDWGTSNLRAYLLENDKVIDKYSSDKGLNNARTLGFEKILGEVLIHFDAPINIPIKLSGMIGSKHGWKEAPYADCPVTVDSIKQNTVQIEGFPNVEIFGGVCYELPDGKKDVMRGEEVQVFGILEKFPHAEIICLPGTHSKWVKTQNASIENFSTWMTGELFKCLSENIIFKEQISTKTFCKDSFQKGVSQAEKAGPILNSLFHLRTDYLFAHIQSSDFHSYLSGFLIGSEVKDAAGECDEVIVCGSDKMIELYSIAFSHFGIFTVEFPASEATVLGMLKVTQG